MKKSENGAWGGAIAGLVAGAGNRLTKGITERFSAFYTKYFFRCRKYIFHIDNSCTVWYNMGIQYHHRKGEL